LVDTARHAAANLDADDLKRKQRGAQLTVPAKSPASANSARPDSPAVPTTRRKSAMHGSMVNWNDFGLSPSAGAGGANTRAGAAATGGGSGGDGGGRARVGGDGDGSDDELGGEATDGAADDGAGAAGDDGDGDELVSPAVALAP